jgi:hypothetical protein
MKRSTSASAGEERDMPDYPGERVCTCRAYRVRDSSQSGLYGHCWQARHAPSAKRHHPKSPAGYGICPDFHNRQRPAWLTLELKTYPRKRQTPRPSRLGPKSVCAPAQNPVHAPVDRLHLIENTSTYNPRFSIDEKFRKRRTRLFFDSFSSFSGWCGVRGSS